MSDSEDSDHQPVDNTLPPCLPDLMMDCIASAAINQPGPSSDDTPPIIDIPAIDRELVSVWYNQTKFLRARFDEAIRLSYRAGLMESANDHSLSLVQAGAALVGQIYETLPVTNRSHAANMEALNAMEARTNEFAEDVWTSLQVSDAVLELDETVELSDEPDSAAGDLSDVLPEDSGEEQEGGPKDNGDIGSDAAAEPVCTEEPTFSDTDDEFDWS